MEDNFEKCLNQIMSTNPNCTGVLFADKNGLCLGSKGISKESAGIAAALSEEVCKLEANANSPIICLQSGNKTCLIQKNAEITGMIYKTNSPR